MAAGMDRLDHPIAPMPAVNRVALDRANWPDEIDILTRNYRQNRSA
jgi:hypothetical protein